MYRQEVDNVSNRLDTVQDNLNDRIDTVQDNLESLSTVTDGLVSYRKKMLIDVNDYGADPTGTTDSTTAFKNAIQAATDAKVQGIYVGNGNYKIIEGNIVIDGGLRIFGNLNFFPQEFFTAGIPDGNSRIDVEADIAFIVNGYTVSNYQFGPICIKGVKVVGNSSNTFMRFTATGGSTRPSKIENCEFVAFQNVIEMRPTRTGTMLDCLTIDTSIFRSNQYIIWSDEAYFVGTSYASLGSLFMFDCVVDAGFGLITYNTHGCLRFYNNIFEGTTRDTDVHLHLNDRGSAVFDGCYFEALHGSINVYGRKTASQAYSNFVEKNTSSFGGADLIWNVKDCIVDMNCKIISPHYFTSCVFASCESYSIGKGSYGVLHSVIASDHPTQATPGSSYGIVANKPLYTPAQMGDCTFTLNQDSEVIIYGYKLNGNTAFTLYDANNETVIAITLPYESGLWFISLADTLTSGEYRITTGGSVPNMARVNANDSWYVNYRIMMGIA